MVQFEYCFPHDTEQCFRGGDCLLDWYYKEGDKRVGPLAEAKIRELAAAGTISDDTMVWNEISSRWRRYGDVLGTAQNGQPAGHTAAPASGSIPPPYQPPAAPTAYQPPAAPPAYQAPAQSSFSDPFEGDPPPTHAYDRPMDARPESYCSSCFRKFPTVDMKQGASGMLCANCSDSTHHAIGTSVDSSTLYAVEFTGSGKEYFRIWIVNILLSIITLGIYSAWAKVRKNRYFYRNTKLAGSSFDYHGNPKAILKGRILAVALVAILQLSQKFSPGLYPIVLIFVLALLPWMLTRAYSFRLYNTSWRGIRMHFHASVANAYLLYIVYGFLTIITLGLCFPLFYRQMRLFLVNNAAFGTTRSSLTVSGGEIYGVFFRTWLLSVGVTAIMFVAIGALAGLMGKMSLASGKLSYGMIIWIVLLIFAAYQLNRVIVMSFFRTRMANLVWDNTTLGPVRFESHQRARDLASIIATNALLTFITLGMYWPWAKVQLTKYYADTLFVSAPEGLNSFVADTEAAVAASGEEITEAMDVDFSF